MPSPEFDLIRLAGRAELDEERAAAFYQSATGELDWPKVVWLASYHRLAPLLYVHLRDHAEDQVPADVLDALRDYVKRMSVHILFLSSEMAKIAERLEVDEIPYLVLKGPSLAEAYGGVAKRPFVDNDLLVHREDFGRVEQALLDLGFNERKRSDLQQSGYLFVYGEYTFGRAVGAFTSTVDVHTNLVPFGLSYAPSFEDMMSRSRPIEMAGAEVPVLEWEDLFLTLSVNALKDQWNRLRLASDLAEVGALVEDWDAVLERAARFGSLRAVHLGLLITVDEVGGEFPDRVIDSARRDRRAVALAREMRSFLTTSDEERVMPGAGRVKLNLLVQDGLRGQIRYSGYAAVRRMMERWVNPRR